MLTAFHGCKSYLSSPVSDGIKVIVTSSRRDTRLFFSTTRQKSLPVQTVHPLRRLSLAQQTAAHLRSGLCTGRWRETLPGVTLLATDLDVSPPTIRAALRLLEKEGLLRSRGRGRSRTVAPGGAPPQPLRVGILLHDSPLLGQSQSSQDLLQIQHDLEAAGNEVFFSGKSQVELHHDVQRIVRHVQESSADAWVVDAGSRGLLEWFAGQAVPAIALYGRSDGLPIARSGPDKVPAILEATRQLIALGHQRIVLIVLGPRRKPTPGKAEQAFLDELAAHGVSTGDYHLPDWEETPEGFSTLLETLFRTTPPTALIVDETPRVIAAMHFLARHRIRVPEEVSLVSTDYDSSLAWCSPTVAHIFWDPAPVVRRIVRWIAALRKGNWDRKTINFPAEFRPGGSIGSAPGARSQAGLALETKITSLGK